MLDDSTDGIPNELHFPADASAVGDGVPERWGTSLRSDVHPPREIVERLQELEKRVAASLSPPTIAVAGFDFRLRELEAQLRQRLAEFEADEREREARLRCARELLLRQLLELRACDFSNGSSTNGAGDHAAFDGKLRRQIAFVLESVVDDLGALLAKRQRGYF